MSALEITFRVPDPAGIPAEASAPGGVVALGRRHFRVYAGQWGFPLPEVLVEREPGSPGYVTVHLPPRVDVRAEPGVLIPAQLAHALETIWVPQDYTAASVDGPRILSLDSRLPVSLVYGDPRTADVFGSGHPTDVRVDVHWSLEYTGSVGADTASASVALEFAPLGEQPPPASRDGFGEGPGLVSDDEDEFLRLRPPQPTGDNLQQFVAVDLGSTASTATLWDLGAITQRQVDPGQTTALAQLLGELLSPPADAPPEWRKAVESITAGELVLGRRGGLRITGRQALSRLDDADVVDALMVKVEQSLHQDGRPALRDWLVPRLFEGYARVMNTPALDRHKLRPVDYPDINGQRTRAPASALIERASQSDGGLPPGSLPGLDATLPGDRRFELPGSLGEPPAAMITGIKRAVLQQQPPAVNGSDMSAVHLAQHLYLRLVERAEDLMHRQPGHERPTVRTAVITYPTTILPEIKQRLEKLVRSGLGIPQVVMDYDEGLAACLFFVMRELSDNQNLGLEALRAQSRHVSDDPPTWHRILLAIDIGGCTTDIALLRLALVDTTPSLTQEQEFVSGRDYRLEPQLLGSTGHGQLGGDLLTLQVFYWIKACLVDQLRSDPAPSATGSGASGDREERRLSTRVAEQASEMLRTIVAPDVRRDLDHFLPTRWDGVQDEEERTRRRGRFDLLWRLAESRKRSLGAGEDDGVSPDATIEEVHVIEILNSGSHRLGTAKEVALDPAEFRTLIEPVLRRAAEMGADLVRTVFTRIHEDNAKRIAKGLQPQPVPVLDQVVLSGRSSALEQVGQTVVGVLTHADAGSQVRLGWNPTALSVEKGSVAKQATSIGAAWAHSTQALAGQLAMRNRLSATDPVIRLSELDIQTRGLFSSLPGDFGTVAAGEARVLTVLRAGTPFAELDARGRRGVRTGWKPLTEVVMLHRATSSKDHIQWGSFNLVLSAGAESLPEPLHEVWRRKDGTGVNYQLEMDQELFPYILLCRGLPHLLVNGQPLELDGARQGLSFDAGLHTFSLPGSICVSLGEPHTGKPDLVEVFPAPGSEETYLNEFFHDSTDSEQQPVPGRAAVLDAPPVHGAYHFYLVREGTGEPEDLGRLPAPGLADHWASLDAHGRLRVHRGAVPHLPAETLREVEQRPGRVLRRPMSSGLTEFNEYWDPSTGRH
ncbi:hypothetical protein GCM10010260_39020 [Streptomyces filipinensis]|uniref:Molecular chaperone n=1 Tax=Streptomyces filipinensis TaxID=66887 RepID=A0A918IBM0_9ACTN|nr:hypothetical protein [Streptomyces filipinensis]GGU99031.1 hypothetical protein GCM10010260_39020 [Streptomyces filipinensis]